MLSAHKFAAGNTCKGIIFIKREILGISPPRESSQVSGTPTGTKV